MPSSNNIIKFSYNGVIEEGKTSTLINSIKSQVEVAEHIEFKGLLVSLKNASYDNNQQNLASLIKQMSVFNKQIAIPIAIIDYNIAIYKLLQKLSKNTNLKLFKNSTAARIFLDPKAYKKGMQILIYDNDEENIKKLTKELTTYGYIVRIAKNQDEYLALSKEEDYDVIVTQSTLNLGSDTVKKSSNALSLSKKLVENLPVFMDTAVETLVSFTGLEAKKSSHGIKRFDVSFTNNVICAVMHFNGDIEGTFVLIFPKDIALIAMESLFGEEMDANDTEAIMDGVGEFCNTITGSTKTSLSAKDIKIIFELPKKYDSIEQTVSDVGNENGIWIDMQLAGKPFYMFITK